MSRSLLVALLCLLPVASFAQEIPQAVRDTVREMLRGGEPDSMALAPMSGLYEVTVGAQVVYVSADGQYLLRGDLIDMERQENLTDAARRTARVSTLAGLDDAGYIVFGPDQARHTVTVFTDIDCAYCARLHQQMSKYNRLGIRIKYAAFPRAGIPSRNYDETVSVWCADDPHRAIGEAKAGRAVAPRECRNPVRDHYVTGRMLGVSGTPTIVMENGNVIPGYLPPPRLLEHLDAEG